MKSKRHYKIKIKKALERRGDEQNYFPTEAVAVRWYNILNQSLFENKLTRPQLIVKRLRGCKGQLHMDWDARYSRKGTCNQNHIPYHNPTFGYVIELHHRFETWRTFIETLAHEMVHQWQVEILKDPTANHNKNFFAWREKFSKYKMELGL